LRSVALREVGALGRHAHVMRVEQLLDPPGLLHGQARGLHLVLLLVLLVVEGGNAVGHGHLSLHLGIPVFVCGKNTIATSVRKRQATHTITRNDYTNSNHNN